MTSVPESPAAKRREMTAPSSPGSESDGSASPSPSSPSPPPSPSAKPKLLPNGAVKCRFNDCDNAAAEGTDKCEFHKNRRQCCVENCTNQVYARKLCVRHGGKKQCQADNCDAHARGGGYCLQHGGFVVKRFCIVEGCSRQAHARQKCVRHGGGRRCKVDGCMQHARAGGLCNRHSHGHHCRIEGCKKTAQHSGSICFRHAMELRAHGEQVPELNISKGGRLSSKKRQQLQQEQQMKQEQFHHQQLQQQQMHNQQQQPTSEQQKHHQHQQQQQQQSGTSAHGSQSSSQSNSSANPGPFGLPLKITVPASMPKFNSMKTPLGGFPTPRSHDFSLLMGLPSPQIDQSQLPSVLAMANQQRSIYENPAPSSGAFMAGGPPSLTRGQRTPGQNFLSLGVFPTPTPEKHGNHQGVDEDLDVIISSYHKFIGGSASPLAYHHAPLQPPPPPPALLESIGLTMYDHTGHPVHPAAFHAHAAALQARHHHLTTQAPGAAHLHRLKMEYVHPHPMPLPHGYEGYAPPAPLPQVDAPSDYTAQFFADSASAAEKAARMAAAAKPAPPNVGAKVTTA